MSGGGDEADEHGALVGTAEIAAMLGISRQRADTLSRQVGFPEPVRRVIPLDAVAFTTLREIFQARGEKPLSLDQAIELFVIYSDTLPMHPRLWRRSSVELWASERR
jgi:hypothetical protein